MIDSLRALLTNLNCFVYPAGDVILGSLISFYSLANKYVLSMDSLDLCALVQYRNVTVIHEQAIGSPASYLLRDTHLYHRLNR